MPQHCQYTVLVSSTDAYRDCWPPFFHLFEEYWPRPWPDVVLVTETASFAATQVPVRVVHVGRGARRRPAWGAAVLAGLSAVATALVLYMQEDYFLYDGVRVDVIDEAARLMLHDRIECVRLMECEGGGPWFPSDRRLLWTVDEHAFFRLSLQAALWHRDAFGSYLRRHETPWQFEVWGSRRAARRGGDIRCLARDVVNAERGQVVPYVPTGIVRGRWNRDVVEPLFATHGIDVDFGRRGFWDAASAAPHRRRLRSVPARVRSLW